MKKPKRGRPPKSEDELHNVSLMIRVGAGDKEAFSDAAKLAGVPLSAWVRERLRQVAMRELKSAAQPVAFMKRLAHN